LTVWPSPQSSKKEPTTIEFKFNFETCSVKLAKEMKKPLGGDPSPIGARGSNWDVMHKVRKDVIDKQPDLFVWIICSRDLAGLGDNELDRVVNWEPLQKYRRLHPYKTDREFLLTADRFLQILHRERAFTVYSTEVETNGYFPSIYHFRICEFTRACG
jgi:hypothetical protein